MPLRPPVRICANLIVKNERDNIEDCLRSIRPFIDLFAIVDTGSTDDTIAIIRKFAKANKLPGEVISRPWKNFAQNRNEALRHAEKVISKFDQQNNSTWYVLFMDADNMAAPGSTLSADDLEKDLYLAEMKSANISYQATWLAKICDEIRWEWRSPVHEYLTTVSGTEFSTGFISTATILRGTRGERSRNKHTYLEDAILLLKEVRENPDDTRSVFYAAQSFRDAGRWDLALPLYKQRAEMGGWPEEVYESLMQIGINRLQEGNNGAETYEFFLDAFEQSPNRLDAPFYLIQMWRLQNKFQTAWNFARSLIDSKPPPHALFLRSEIHAWAFFEEAGLCAFYAGDRKNFRKLLKRVLQAENLPLEVRQRTESNLSEFG